MAVPYQLLTLTSPSLSGAGKSQQHVKYLDPGGSPIQVPRCLHRSLGENTKKFLMEFFFNHRRKWIVLLLLLLQLIPILFEVGVTFFLRLHKVPLLFSIPIDWGSDDVFPLKLT
uniref:Uncharacterized protein n=1 Tax=Cacopsylla melanoneura TaxID=428564 RepID=A0A8D8WPL1_9HEMI